MFLQVLPGRCEVFARTARHVATAVSTIKVGKDGFEVSSPVLGVIILALSLGFFYLYPVYAYPIHEIF